MFVIGIDLSGPSNSKETAVAVFAVAASGELRLHSSLAGADDRDIFLLAQSLGARGDMIAGIDAPLSYNIGGGDRPADAALRKKIIAAGLQPGSVMVPTMTRMVYLTLRGMAVARLLRAAHEKTAVVEVHPGAAMVLRGAPVDDVAAFKFDSKCRLNLLAWLEGQGLRNVAAVQEPTDHYVAACGAALAAWKWHINETKWLHRAVLPFHPFDFAC